MAFILRNIELKRYKMDITQEYLTKKYGSEALKDAWECIDKDETIPLLHEEVERLCKSSLRGHETKLVDGLFYYVDNGKPTIETHKDRPCGKCKDHALVDDFEVYDACLGKLPGIMNCCCGHGLENEAYVQLLDGTVISGKDAIKIIDILKRIKK